MTQENDINILNAEIRKKFNKYNSKHDRDNGRIPAVLYDSENNIYVTLNEKEVAQWYKKSFAEYNKLYINLEDKKILVVPKIVDTNKVTDNVSHIEFQILHDKKYVFNVPILYDQLSQSPGIKNRGTLIIVNKTIKITCLPKDLPSYIIYDSKNVMVNQKIYNMYW